MTPSEEDRAIQQVVERLTNTFAAARPEEVERAVDEARPEFDPRLRAAVRRAQREAPPPAPPPAPLDLSHRAKPPPLSHALSRSARDARNQPFAHVDVDKILIATQDAS